MTSPTKRGANQGPLEDWSTREKLALASAVLKCGRSDTNWSAVSRMIQPFAETKRSADWFSGKNCLRQYCNLIEKVQKPKRKRGTETMGESVVKNLKEWTIDSIQKNLVSASIEDLLVKRVQLSASKAKSKELSNLIAEGRKTYDERVKELSELEAGDHDHRLSDYSDESESERDSDVPEVLTEVWTIFSDEESSVSASIEDPLAKCVQLSSSEVHSEVEYLSPSKATPAGGPNVSPQLKNLVHTAIAGASEDDRPKTQSPTASAPTLSKLLELPPRDRGQSLPSIPGLMTSVKDSTNIPIESIKLVSPPLESSQVIEVEVAELISEMSEEPSGKQSIKDEVMDIVPQTEVIVSINENTEENITAEIIVEKSCPDLPTEKDVSTNQVEEDLSKCDTILHDYPLLETIINSEATRLVEEKDKNDTEVKETLNSDPDVEGDNSKDTIKDTENTSDIESAVEVVPGDLRQDESVDETTEASSELIKSCSSQSEKMEDSYCVQPVPEESLINVEADKTPVEETKDVEVEPPKEIVSSGEIENNETAEKPKEETHAEDPSTDSTDKQSPADSMVDSEPNLTPVEPVDEPSIPSSEPKVVPEPPAEMILSEETDPNKEIPKDDTDVKTEKTSGNENETKVDTKLSKTVTEVSVDLDTPIIETKKEKEELETVSPTKVTESSKTEGTDERHNSVEHEKESTEKAKNHYIGRGKKQLMVTVVENEKGEKIELKTADGSSIKVTRNLSKETGLKIEDLPYTRKATPSLTKEKEDLGMASSTPTKRRRNATVSESKDTGKAVSSSRHTGNKRTPSKANTSTEIKTPNLRSRGGLAAAQSRTEESILPVDSKDTVEPEINKEEKSQREGSMETPLPSALKEAEKPKLAEEHSVVTNNVKDKSEKQDGNDSGDEFSDAMSDIESKKDHSDSDGDADESDSSRKPNSKNTPKAKKERLESADMADDDSSNSANDALAKKRVTRRSVKTSPRKSESKLKNNDDKATFRHRERLSLPAKDTSSEMKAGSRPSKALSRLKHLSEEAHLIYGDLDTQSGDGNGKRITRARAKTGSTPTKSSSPAKNVAQSSEPETSSDAENKTRSTRSRTAAAVQSSNVQSSNTIIEQLPPVLIDSNPSSPCSSTTNSTIFDEDKDQRAFRKSIMLVWNRIAAHKYSSLFLKPISEDRAPGYFEKVKRPMDLATIKRNVETGVTRTIKTFERDVFLMFMNAIMFNPKNHEISEMASEMERDVRAILEEHHKMLKLSQEGGESLTPVTSERALRKDGRSLFTSTPEISALPSCTFSDSDGEMEAIEDEKAKTLANSNQSRKRRAGSNDIAEIPDSKKRKTRTSTSNTNINSSYRKIKPQVSPDIVSASYDM